MGIKDENRRYPPLPLMRDESVIQEQPDQTSLTERYVEESVRFIRENQQGPFFLYLAHMYVHTPLFVPSVFMKKSRNDRYGGAVASIDWAMDVILDELKTLGLEENTLVVFTSDNGAVSKRPESNGFLRGGKGTTWEAGLRVPCIMRWKGKIPTGSVCDKVTTAMDFYSTFSTLAGAEVPTDRIIDGHNIIPLLESGGESASPYEYFFYYMSNRLQAVRKGQWKLHAGRKVDLEYVTVDELYDLRNDPREQENVFDRHPEIVTELQDALQRCRLDIGDEATGVTGQNIRPIGRVCHPKTLTTYSQDHPYIVAMYDTVD